MIAGTLALDAAYNAADAESKRDQIERDAVRGSARRPGEASLDAAYGGFISSTFRTKTRPPMSENSALWVDLSCQYKAATGPNKRPYSRADPAAPRTTANAATAHVRR